MKKYMVEESEWETELADLVEIAKKELLDEFLNNIRFTRTRPYSRIATICREGYITLEDVCSKGSSEHRYSEIGVLYSYAKPWCREKKVTVYRGGSEIRPGDWVALEREYAEWHGTPVYELKVPLSDVVWAGTYEKEWFYIPKRLQGLFKSPEEFWRVCRSERPK
jgi:ribosomal 50S subunit-recycling heat shock protein